MAKKRASRKPSGTDASGQPLDLTSRGAYMDQLDRWFDESNRRIDAQERNKPASVSSARRDERVAGRNVREFQRNAPRARAASDIPGEPGKKGPFAMGPAKAPDKLSGRTAEFGTRSLLEGMKSFMRGGGLRRGSM
jgi:hypothetical protein